MIFCVSVGFSGLVKKGEDSKKDKQYALFIGDTVLVNEVGIKYFDRELYISVYKNWSALSRLVFNLKKYFEVGKTML